MEEEKGRAITVHLESGERRLTAFNSGRVSAAGGGTRGSRMVCQS